MPDNNELVAAWRDAAILRNPGSEKLAEMVTGSTREEVEASAAAAAARVAEIASGTDDTFSQARQAYGPGPSVGGNVGVPSAYAGDRDTQRMRRENAFAQKFNDAPRDSYGQKMGISPAEINEYTSSRFVAHVKNRLNYWASMTRSDFGRRSQ